MARRETRLGGLALVLGGLLWATAWVLNGQTVDGAGEVLGLDEGETRALLNPALVLIGLGLWAFVRRFGAGGGLPVVGAAVAGGIGLALMLAGNLVEFGPIGDPVSDAGWAVFLVGGALALLGVLALGVGLVRVGALPREAGLLFALGLVAFVAGIAAAPLFGVGWFLWGFLLLGA